MRPFNRKSALAALCGIQAFLLGLLVALMVADAIDVAIFLSCVVTTALVTAALTFVIFRKFPPSE